MQNPPPNAPYGSPASAGGKSSTGLDANLAALLSYLFGWVSGLIFFLIEKESRYVRFHAMQSILLNAAVIVVVVGFTIVNTMIAFISGTLAALFGLLWFVILLGIIGIAILCMIKAFQGQEFKLPIIGDMAANFANK